MRPRYDFIITGAGAAGLSLAVRMMHSGRFNDKTILLADRDEKTKNDRTWCFWEIGQGLFESIVYKKWEKAWFHGQQKSREFDLAPYTYKLIRGIDFYQHCFSYLSQFPNVDILKGEVTGLYSDADRAGCNLNGKPVASSYIFNSILQPPVLKRGEHMLLQHFRGWRIKMEKNCFNPAKAVLMDFRVSQEKGTTFVYLLPFSETEALVEYTIFSGKLAEEEEYAEGLRNYITRFFPGMVYEVDEKESGIIPMTDHRFMTHRGRIISIGTAGGQTKASTGYTFSFIQKHSEAIVQAFSSGGDPVIQAASENDRFRFYDSTLLEILEQGKVPGHIIFERLFTRNSPPRIFKFLDNETKLREEVGLLLTLPVFPFLKAAIKNL